MAHGGVRKAQEQNVQTRAEEKQEGSASKLERKTKEDLC